MVSKKDALMLGALALGGIGLASMVSGGDGGGAAMEGLRQGRAGQILGGQQGYTSPGSTIYNLPAQGAVTFPKVPTFDISSLLGQAPISRGAAGISAAPKKKRVIPYLYTGGEVKAGAGSIAPWAMGRSTPAEIGVTTALKIASSGGGGAAKKSVSTPAATAKATSRRTKLISRARAVSQ